MRKLTAITLAATVLFGSSFQSIHAYADANDNLQGIQNKRQEIKGNLSGAEAQITSIMNEIDELNTKIDQVDQEISQKQEIVNQTEEKFQDTIAEIGKLQKEISDLEDDIKKRQEILEDRMSSYQKSGGAISYLEVLFGAQSFSDFISRVAMVNTITESDTNLIKELDSEISAVEDKKNETVNKLDELNRMKQEQEEILAQVQEKKEQNEQRKASLETKQSNLLSVIRDLKVKDSSLASLESDVKQAIAQEQAQNNRELEQLSDEKHVAGKTFTVTSTAYTASCKGCSGITTTGINLKANPNSKVIAVDPTVIPLGSVVYVEGYGYAIAGDIGSAINGKRIDVFVPTRSEALKWGIRRVKVTIQ